MRHSLILLVSLFTITAEAKIQTAEYFYSQSQKLQKSLNEKTTAQEKAKTLKKLQAEFEQTLKDYKKKNTKESTPEEDKVSLLFFTMEPTFNLAKKSKWNDKDCERTESEIRSGDSMGREEGAATTTQAGEALAWIKILCSK